MVQIQISELSGTENVKFLEEKDRKLKLELENFKSKQELETQAFQLKMSSAYNEFKKARAFEFDRIIQKYKNRLKDLENQQKIEMNSLTKMSMNYFNYLFFVIFFFVIFNFDLLIESSNMSSSANIMNSKFMGKENTKINQTVNRSRLSSASKN